MSQPAYVILGASGAVGSAVARRLALQGARLVLGGRDITRLQALADLTGGVARVGDATNTADVDATVALAI